MKLHNVKHDLNTKCWCGLAALSALSGVSTSHAKELIREKIDKMLEGTDRRRVIKGIYTTELLGAIMKLGYSHTRIFIEYRVEKMPSIARALHKYQPTNNKLFLLITPGHFLVSDGKYIVDTARREATLIYDHPCSEWECREIYEISPEDYSNL